MSTHDPRRIVEDLRNNLASHDRPIGFLLGAGCSSAINIAPAPAPGEKPKFEALIPSIIPLTTQCKTAVTGLGEKFKDAWDLLEGQCESNEQQTNIESILSIVRKKIDAIDSGEHLVGLEKKELITLEETLRQTIAKAANPSFEKIPSYIPHDSFAIWLKQATRMKPIEIFTTNYDLLIEFALEKEQIPIFDGFVGCFQPFFHADCLDEETLLPPNTWVRLWKIHGSVNWQIKSIGSGERVVRTAATDSGEMIFPSDRKYDESRKQPYTALLDRLAKLMNKDHALLVVCGHSFGDQHINSVIFTALENNPTAHIISLQYEEINPKGDLPLMASKRTNFTLLGPNAGIIGGIHGDWKLLHSVDDKTCSFMDLAFDSNAFPETMEETTTGLLRLGNFNWFCKFLLTMKRISGD